MSLEILSVSSDWLVLMVALRGASHRIAVSPKKPFFSSWATRSCPFGVSISTSAAPARITYIASPVSPWWQTSWPSPKVIRSPVNASSFSWAGSILEKIGTPLRISTSSLRFIVSSSRSLRRRHQVGIERVFLKIGFLAVGGHPAALHDDHPLERRRLVWPVGDPDHAAAVGRVQDMVTDAVLGAAVEHRHRLVDHQELGPLDQ